MRLYKLPINKLHTTLQLCHGPWASGKLQRLQICEAEGGKFESGGKEAQK